MLGFVRGVVIGLALIGFGWLVGSIFPAPDAVTQPITQRAPDLAARLGITEVSLARLRDYMTPEQFDSVRREAVQAASAAGEAITIEQVEGPIDVQSEEARLTPEAASAPAGAAAFAGLLQLCPGMTVSNAPAADAQRNVRGYTKFVSVNGVAIAEAPTQGACLSSGFGSRNGRMHKGIDLHSASGGPILAAGDGTVIERKYRDDYGNMLLIDHGSGVYTRYAHLSSFSPGVVEGAQVRAGQMIGLMGNTASYQIPVHLHYELLLGDYANPRGSFGLTPRSPFEFAAAP